MALHWFSIRGKFAGGAMRSLVVYALHSAFSTTAATTRRLASKEPISPLIFKERGLWQLQGVRGHSGAEGR